MSYRLSAFGYWDKQKNHLDFFPDWMIRIYFLFLVLLLFLPHPCFFFLSRPLFFFPSLLAGGAGREELMLLS
jgi:hypothetical protein